MQEAQEGAQGGGGHAGKVEEESVRVHAALIA